MKEEEEKRQGEKDEANDDDNDDDRGGKKTHTPMEVREKRERNTEMPMVVLVAGRDAVGTVVYSHRFDRLCVVVCVCVLVCCGIASTCSTPSTPPLCWYSFKFFQIGFMFCKFWLKLVHLNCLESKCQPSKVVMLFKFRVNKIKTYAKKT